MRVTTRVTLALAVLGSGCNSGPERQTTALPRVADPAPMARMTSRQYANTVRDLFAPAQIVSPAFPLEVTAAGGFRNNAAFNTPSGPLVDAYHRAALSVTEQVVAQRELLLPCDPSATSCAREYLSTLAPRVWRRDLEDHERSALVARFDGWAAQHGVEAALQLSLEELLMAPQFLYLPRLGLAAPDDTGVGVPLSSWELASRLSYFLWDSTPDERLLELARQGRLHERAGVGFHGELFDFEAVSSVGVDLDHYRQQGAFEGLEDVEEEDDLSDFYYLEYLPMLRYEPEVFVHQEIFGGGAGTLAALLTSNRTWATPEIAQVAYGVQLEQDEDRMVTWSAAADFGRLGGVYLEDAVFEGDYFPLELDPQRRAGLLTLASFLTSHAGPRQPSPVGRGVAVLDRLLCTTLVPPGDVPPLEHSVEGQEPRTNREKYDIHQQAEACAACHRQIDGIGLVFEHYDSLGRWRARDGGHPVDATGALVGVDTAQPVDGAVELAEALASSRDVHRCYVRQWFRRGFGRSEQDGDNPTVEALQAGFWESGGDIQELIVNIAASHEFRYRRTP